MTMRPGCDDLRYKVMKIECQPMQIVECIMGEPETLPFLVLSVHGRKNPGSTVCWHSPTHFIGELHIAPLGKNCSLNFLYVHCLTSSIV